jgi:hypothetical protein
VLTMRPVLMCTFLIFWMMSAESIGDKMTNAKIKMSIEGKRPTFRLAKPSAFKLQPYT